MFVSFADAVRAPDDDARTLAIPERRIFAVMTGARDAMDVFASAIDGGARTSTRTDDVAEVIDGAWEELRMRDERVVTPLAFALVVVEEDALAFFAAGACAAYLAGAAFRRVALEGAQDGSVRFFRAYVRQGTRVVLVTALGAQRREVPESALKDVAKEAAFLVDGTGSRAPAAAVVLRVDEEPRIR